MTFEHHPVDALLRAAVVDPTPTYADELAGRRALAAAIAAESAAPASAAPRSFPTRRFGWLRLVPTVAAVAAVLIAVVALTSMLSPEPVTALGELATVAERRTAPATAEGEFVYTRSAEIATHFIAGEDIGLANREAVAYLLQIDRERWQTADGKVVERATVGAPAFFDDEVAAAYAAAGWAARDRVGETIEAEFDPTLSLLNQRDWPADAEPLRAEMEAQASAEGNPIAPTAALVGLAGDLLKEPAITPQLRGAVFQVLDGLGLDVVVRDNGRQVQVGIDYTDTVPTRLELVFDSEANLVTERVTWIDGADDLGVPAGTVIQETQLSPVRVVDSIRGS